MSILLYLLKVIGCSGILFGYYYLFLRNKRFHHYNRFYLIAALGLSMVLPLIRIHVSEDEGTFRQMAWQSVKVVTLQATAADAAPAPIAAASRSFTLSHLLWIVYGIGVLYLLVMLIRSLLYIKKLSLQYPYERIEQLKLYQTNEPGTPFSFFRSIYWNEELNFNSVKGQQIFRHELFHVQQRHSADTIAAELITMFGWFNPFFYLIKRELKAIHEFLADQYAASGSNRYQYAELLVQQVMESRSPAITHPFFQNQLKRRIAMIMQHHQSKYGYWSRVMVLPISVFLFFSVSLYAQERKAEKLLEEKVPADISAMVQEGAHKYGLPPSQEFSAEDSPGVHVFWPRTSPVLEAVNKEVFALPLMQLRFEIFEEGYSSDYYLLSKWETLMLAKTMLARGVYAASPEKEAICLASYQRLLGELNAQYGKKLTEMEKPGYQHKLSATTEALLLDECRKALNDGIMTQSTTKPAQERWVISFNQDTVPISKDPKVRFTTRTDTVQSTRFKTVYDTRVSYTDSTRSVNFITLDDQQMRYADTTNYRFVAVKDKKMRYADTTHVKFYKGDPKKIYYPTDTVIRFEAVPLDTIVPKLQRFFNKNYRYPVDFLENHGEGSIYYSFVLDEKGSLKDYEVYNSAPKADKIYEIVIVGYADKEAAKTLSTEEKHQYMKGEVDRVATKYAPLSGKYKPTRYYFKATWKVQKEGAAVKPITFKPNEANKTYVKVEEIPFYTGGAPAWKKYLDNNQQYPAKAKANKVEGTVLVQFVVKKDGSVNDIQAISGPDELKAEAHRLVSNSAANWQPAKQGGNAVNAYRQQPIVFKL